MVRGAMAHGQVNGTANVATCPWGSAWGSGGGVQDAFTLAEMRAAAKRGTAPAAPAPAPVPGEVDELATARSNRSDVTALTSVSKASRASRASAVKSVKAPDMEAKMMELIAKCVEKKVEELTETTKPKSPVSTMSPVSPGLKELRTSRSALSARSVSEASSMAPSWVELEENLRAVQPEKVTMAGKKKKAEKLSDASLGRFDADASRLAYLEMQKSAAAARNKNRSALTFDDEPEQKPKVEKPEKTSEKSEKKGYPALLTAEAEPVSMYGKQKRKEKLSDAQLGKFDKDKSRDAYLVMQQEAEQMRNKHRVGQGIF